jgi:oxygen-independent coproporphyrinogen-3 oxidase
LQIISSCLHETMDAMADSPNAELGIYISIPFCRSKCTYCNFASGVYPASEHERYINRLIEDLKSSADWAAQMGVELPRQVDSVYLGGGTPSLLAPELVAHLFAAVRSEFQLTADAEITVECAPGQIADPTLDALAAAGVNRVSLGVQSFIDREAALSGRLHSRDTTLDDIRRLRSAGIANLSVDLIAGLAEQTFDSWDQSLAVLVDEDSRLGREMLSGGARYHAGLVPNDDSIAQMYSVATERLAAAGLQQYEISNFSRPGSASRHNLRYWHRRPYLGLGLDASSMLRTNQAERYVLRSTTTDDLAAFMQGRQAVETAWLSPARQHEEAWFLGLRLNAGVEIAALEQEFGADTVAPALQAVAQLAEDGLLTSDGHSVRLTTRGQLLSNEVFHHFLELETHA